MSALERLLKCTGQWQGRYTLHDPENEIDDQSDSSLSVKPLLQKRFARLDYAWAYKGSPQEGSMLIGHNPKTGEVTAHWIDSWHNGTRVVPCTGQVSDDGAISVLGSYPAPPGPDWGWRTVISPSLDSLEILMYNVSPDGNEELAVEMAYSKD